jgi:DNA-binding NtrC family response regulator
MNGNAPRALLAGENLSRSSCLVSSLQEMGVECISVASCGEAQALLETQAFDLVLSELCPPDGCAARLIQCLIGSSATMFYLFPVEDSCWWLPAVKQGQPCFGSPALRPHAFTEVLNTILHCISPAHARAEEPARRNTASQPPREPPLSDSGRLRGELEWRRT